ncbi:MAG: FtsQ-type POTRA domain-containing protein [Alphaproteobacteria bacterium]|nr:FtsQ-type POTRA domain-containing protein [Alphaproteobacteria bacterium]
MQVGGDNLLKTKENFVYPEREWAYRLCGFLMIFLVVVSLSFISITIRDNIISVWFDKTMSSMYKMTAKHGLYVEDIIVEGNYRTSYDDLVEALNLSENESILGINIAQLKSRIEQLTWVKSCVVKRSFFPNNIIVEIKEREVIAIWHYEGRYYPVDNEGHVIEVEEYEPDASMLILAGDGAPHHLAELLKVLDLDKELKSRVKGAVFVSNRRWDLIFETLDNGVVVKLPEKNFDKAYQKIALLNKRQGIFKRKLTSFDVRFDDRIVVDIDKSFLDLDVKK